MSNSLAIQPIDLYGLASIRQLMFQSLLSARSANSASSLDSTSSIVQLSALGQVLGAGARLQGSLEALQSNTADATHALQLIMADSALRDVIFNPAYSALIASSHMSDFAVPMARTRTGTIPAEIPGAVLPINRIGAISSYQDAASAFVGR